MNDPSRLEMLRFTRRVIEQQARRQLAQIDRWIAEEQQRLAIQARTAPPPGPDYRLQRGLTADRAPVQLHTGNCGKALKAPGVNEDIARRVLAEGVEACAVCRPDAELGWIDG